MTKNRIVTTPEDFIVKANKRGVLFPVLVIAAAVVALGLGGAAFYFLFQRGESQIVRGAVGTITAEGQLIQAVRREANGKILEKNQEINTIQGRLADIDKQRQDLQSNMDSKVSKKEQELRAQMALALEAEKARLQKEGLSKQAIALRMQQIRGAAGRPASARYGGVPEGSGDDAAPGGAESQDHAAGVYGQPHQGEHGTAAGNLGRAEEGTGAERAVCSKDEIPRSPPAPRPRRR